MTRQLLSTWRKHLPSADFGTPSALIASFRRGCEPAAIMLTCWELRGAPHQMAHARPGQMLVVQNPGGLIPACDGNPDATVASIQLALRNSQIEHLVVCGHRGCRTLPLLLGDVQSDYLREYRELVADVRDGLRELDQNLTVAQRRDVAVQETVLQQLVHLRSYPEIRTRLNTGRLHLHGWLYDEATARVAFYSPYSGSFTY